MTIITSRTGTGSKGRCGTMGVTPGTNGRGIMTVRGVGLVVMINTSDTIGLDVTDLTDAVPTGIKETGRISFIGEVIAANQHRRGIAESCHSVAMRLVTSGAGIAIDAATASGGTVIKVAVFTMTGFTVSIIICGTTGEHVVVGQAINVCCGNCVTGITGVGGICGIKGGNAAVTTRCKGRFRRSSAGIDRCNDTDMAGCAVDRGGIGPNRLTVVAGGDTVGRTVTGITDGILIVGNQTGGTISMTGAGTGAIIGMADGTSQLHAVGCAIYMLVVGTRKGGASAGRNAGNTVLMAGTAITAGGNIPVRSCTHMTGDGTGTGRFGVGPTGTECNIRNTINVFDARSTAYQG